MLFYKRIANGKKLLLIYSNKNYKNYSEPLKKDNNHNNNWDELKKEKKRKTITSWHEYPVKLYRLIGKKTFP